MSLSDIESVTSPMEDDTKHVMDEKKDLSALPVEGSSHLQPDQNTSGAHQGSSSQLNGNIEGTSHLDEKAASDPDGITPSSTSHPQSQTEPSADPPASQDSAPSNAQSSESNITSTDASGPPSLQYTLRTRKLYITIFWSLILVDSIAIPIVLYFTLDRLTSLSNNAVFSISTGALGGISILEYVLRLWRLWRKDSTCRVVGAKTRWYFDWFHWNFSAAWFFPIAELIIGTCFDNPPIRVLAMPASSLLFWFGIELLVEDTLRVLGKKSPVRISSLPKGEPFRPSVYSYIEDVVAVDGSGGTDFRRRLDVRFRASHVFRQMLASLSWFWGAGSLGIAILTTALVFTIQRDKAYVVGWTVPFVWAGFWTMATFAYVFRCLRIERETWNAPKA